MDQAAAQAAPAHEPIRLKVAGMDCGSCALTIESSLRQLPGVETASVSFTTEALEVSGDVSVDAIAARLNELGYRIASAADVAAVPLPEHHGLKGFLRFLWQQPPLQHNDADEIPSTILVTTTTSLPKPVLCHNSDSRTTLVDHADDDANVDGDPVSVCAGDWPAILSESGRAIM